MKFMSAKEIKGVFSRTIFIVSTPRSGSTMLFNLLKQAPDVWTIGGESHGIYKEFPGLRAENDSFDSACLSNKHADSDTCLKMRSIYLSKIMNRDGVPYLSDNIGSFTKSITFLEKTPRNSLNIKFLLQVFPEAKFIFLHRDAKQNISSIIEAWGIGQQTGQFVTFRQLPDFKGRHWCLILPPGWRKYKDKSIAEIAAFQWKACNDIIMKDLSKLKYGKWMSLSYQDLITNPEKQIRRICDFSSLTFDDRLKGVVNSEIPLSETTITAPASEKWKRHESEILPILPQIRNTVKKLSQLKY